MDDTTDKYIRSTMGAEMLVKDVMTSNVISVSKYDSIVKVGNLLAEKNISGLPVVDKENKVLGIVAQADILSMVGLGREHTLKDLLKFMLGERMPEKKMGDIVGDIMTSSVATIGPEANVAEAVRIMDDKKIRRLVVVDGTNTLIGILSRADILKAVMKKLR